MVIRPLIEHRISTVSIFAMSVKFEGRAHIDAAAGDFKPSKEEFPRNDGKIIGTHGKIHYH